MLKIPLTLTVLSLLFTNCMIDPTHDSFGYGAMGAFIFLVGMVAIIKPYLIDDFLSQHEIFLRPLALRGIAILIILAGATLICN